MDINKLSLYCFEVLVDSTPVLADFVVCMIE